MTAPVLLCRIDHTRNMRRFYRLDVQPDLFGGVLLVRQWGRIGTCGRIVDESYASEPLQRTRCRNRPKESDGGVTRSKRTCQAYAR